MWYLTRLSLRLGPVVLLAVVLLFGGGVLAATQLQQDLLPDISVPTYVVVTPYPGASPGVIDQQVTLPVVNAVQGISGVNTVNSTSSSGASIIEVQFNDGTDTTAAEQRLSSTLDRVRATLPQQARPPTIEAFSTSQLPILQYAVSADESQGALATQLRTIAAPKLRGLAGVSTVNITGAPTQEVQVTLDPGQLAAHGVTISQVANALQQASMVQSVGTVQDGGRTVPLQVSSSLTSTDQIAGLPVAQSGGTGNQGASGAGTGGAGQPGSGSVAPGAGAQPQAAQGPGATPRHPVSIGELGTVQLVAVPADTITRTNGRLSIGVSILKNPNANTVTVANEVKGALPDIEHGIGHRASFQSIQDQATPITDAIASILREGLLGALFAILVIFAFLRSVRATLVAAISIPLSLLVALLILWWQGITLNILTLGGMMVAIGRIVDDAIVVLENISRHVSEGETPLDAARMASREIVTAVTASTLTTVGVFLPIAFLTGIAGDFFRPFALTVVAALLASLLVAVTVVPLLASRLLPRPRRARPDAVNGWLQRAYVPVVRWATGHRAVSVVTALLILAGALALIPRVRVNLLDQSSSPNFPIAITMPDNATLAQTNAETEQVERLVRNVHSVKAYQATVGGTPDPFAPPGTLPADPTTAQVLVLVDTGSYNQVVHDVGAALSGYHGPARVAVGQAQSSSNASSSGVQLDVHDTNPATLSQATNQVVAALSQVSGLTSVKSNLTASKPQYDLVPTPALDQSGLTLQALAGIVAQAVGGQVATQATLQSGQIDVRVQLPPGTVNTLSGLGALQVPTAAGPVPLSTLATLEQVPGPQSINRTNGDQTATITASISGNDTRAVQARVNSALQGLSLPSGASVSTGGVFQQLSTVLTQFALAIAGAIGLVYLIMVATFRSLIKPLILLVSIPFAAIGAILALVVSGTSLSLPGLIGLLMLIGIVVTNAIVLLDLVEQYRERGLGVQEALIEGGRHRLRPILMTAVATMLALTPLAASGSNSGGAFISAPLAVVVIGGLFTSTLLTLVLVPVLYSIVARFTSARTSLRAPDATPGGDQEPPALPAPRQAATPVPVVTIAATPGTDGRAVAALVAERLGVRLLDLTGSIDELARTLEEALSGEVRSPASLSQLLSSITPAPLAGEGRGGGEVVNRSARPAFEGSARESRTRLRDAALKLIAGSGGVVLSPIAAVVLRSQPGALHVRLDAPPARRIEAARVGDEPDEAVIRRLDESAQAREAYLRQTYGIDGDDPRLYQVTLDPTALSAGASADLIVTAVESSLHQAAQEPVPAGAT